MIIQNNFKYNIRNCNRLIFFCKDSKHQTYVNCCICLGKRNFFSFKKNDYNCLLQFFMIFDILNHIIKQRIVIVQQCFFCVFHILNGPYPATVLVYPLAYPTDQKRISVCIKTNFLTDSLRIYKTPCINGIFIQHFCNFLCGKAHINIKISRYIPWTIVLSLCLWTKLQFKVLDIIYSRQNHALERCIQTFLHIKIFAPQQSKKIQKYLIVRTFINFIH